MATGGGGPHVLRWRPEVAVARFSGARLLETATLVIVAARLLKTVTVVVVDGGVR